MMSFCSVAPHPGVRVKARRFQTVVTWTAKGKAPFFFKLFLVFVSCDHDGRKLRTRPDQPQGGCRWRSEDSLLQAKKPGIAWQGVGHDVLCADNRRLPRIVLPSHWRIQIGC